MFTKTIFAVVIIIVVNCFLLIGNSYSQWQSDVRLTNDPQKSYTSFGNARCVAANGDVVHIVWYSGDSVGVGKWDIFYKRSTDKGLTWSEAVNLSNSDSVRYNPAIAVSGNYVHVVWYDRRDGNSEEYYKRSTDGGITWEAEVRLTNKTAGSGHCSITASGLNVHIVWFDYRDGLNGFAEIYYKRSVDGGVNWLPDVRLSNTAAQSWMPAVAVSGSTVHVAWYDSTAGNWEIYYKRSLDGGLTWGADTRLTNNTATSQYPSMAVSGTNVHIVWTDYRNGSYDIYYKRSINGGTSWGADTRLTKNNFYSAYPSIAVNGSVIHIVYQQNWTTGFDLMYNVSNNNGTKWGNDVHLNNNPSYSGVSSIAVSGSNLHILFRDNRDGNYEIYYKRNLTAQASPLEVTQINSEIPNVYSLNQNYPNPFNPVTTIKFDIPKDNFVTLKIYNMLGREVATLVNNKLSGGTYSINWNASQFSSGIYFYKIQAGEFTDVKRMILVK